MTMSNVDHAIMTMGTAIAYQWITIIHPTPVLMVDMVMVAGTAIQTANTMETVEVIKKATAAEITNASNKIIKPTVKSRFCFL